MKRIKNISIDHFVHVTQKYFNFQNCPFFAESIILEDLERVFEDGGEDSKLTNSVLKLCLAQPPCKDCHSQMSAWLMAGRLAAIELHHVSHSDSQVPRIQSRSEYRIGLVLKWLKRD